MKLNRLMYLVLLYSILGTMAHVSMGTFAVISIMVFAPVSQFSTDPEVIPLIISYQQKYVLSLTGPINVVQVFWSS